MIDHNQYIGWAARLLVENFLEGDWDILEALCHDQDDDTFHNLQISALDMFDNHPGREATQTLLSLYEYGPCSFCRRSIVKALHSIDALPDSIRQECLYDSNEDIRYLAKNSFVDST